MSEKKEKVEITNESVENDIYIDERPSEEWMKHTKYKIYMDLKDQAYTLLFEPDIKGLADKYNLTEATVKRYINELNKEYLVYKKKIINNKPDIKEIAKKHKVSDKTLREYYNILFKENLIVPKYKTLVSIPGLFVGRMGQPICAICGSELEEVKEKVTKNGYYQISGKCPVCKKGSATFRAKASVEKE